MKSCFKLYCNVRLSLKKFKPVGDTSPPPGSVLNEASQVNKCIIFRYFSSSTLGHYYKHHTKFKWKCLWAWLQEMDAGEKEVRCVFHLLKSRPKTGTTTIVYVSAITSNGENRWETNPSILRYEVKYINARQYHIVHLCFSSENRRNMFSFMQSAFRMLVFMCMLCIRVRSTEQSPRIDTVNAWDISYRKYFLPPPLPITMQLIN